MKISIDRATLADSAAVFSMIERIHTEEYRERVSQIAATLLLDGVMRMIKSPLAAVFVARATSKKRVSKVIGAAIVDFRVHPILGFIAWGEYIYVDSAYRGSDAATLLYRAAEDMARLAGANGFYTEAKPEVKSWLEKKGFTEYNVIMRKSLIDVAEEVKANGKDSE